MHNKLKNVATIISAVAVTGIGAHIFSNKKNTYDTLTTPNQITPFDTHTSQDDLIGTLTYPKNKPIISSSRRPRHPHYNNTNHSPVSAGNIDESTTNIMSHNTDIEDFIPSQKNSSQERHIAIQEKTNHTTHNNSSISSPGKGKKEHILKTIEKPPYIQPLLKSLDIIIQPSEKILFDKEYLQQQFFTIITSCIQQGPNSMIYYINPNENTKQTIYGAMDNMKNHIIHYEKNGKKNGKLIQWFLGYKQIRSTLSSQLKLLYHTFIQEHQLSYQGGEEEFIKNMSEVIDLYRKDFNTTN